MFLNLKQSKFSKLLYYLKQFTHLIKSNSNYQMMFSRELEQFFQFVQKYKRPQIAKAVLKKKKKKKKERKKEKGDEGNRLSDFILYYKATVIKRVQQWHKNRNIDQWNRIESTKINLCIYSNMIYDKSIKKIQWRKDSLQ